jgi:hypothetical protein
MRFLEFMLGASRGVWCAIAALQHFASTARKSGDACIAALDAAGAMRNNQPTGR